MKKTGPGIYDRETMKKSRLDPPYDSGEANFLRLNADAAIQACFYCTNLAKFKRYWPKEMLKFVGSRTACPQHFRQFSGEGRV